MLDHQCHLGTPRDKSKLCQRKKKHLIHIQYRHNKKKQEKGNKSEGSFEQITTEERG